MRRKILIGVVVLAAAGTAGGAYAATQASSNPRQAYLNDVAKRLGVSPSKLRAAMTGAFLDRLNADVKAGRLTQAQADRIKRRIERRGGIPFGLRGLGRARGFELRGHAGPLNAAARYLGLDEAQLLSDLRAGQTLAHVAQAQGKSVAGLEQVLTTQAKTRIDRAVSAGVITKAQAERIESRLAKRIDRLVNRGLPRFVPRFAPGPPPGPAYGGPALGAPVPGAPNGGPAVGAPMPAPPPGA
jgi:hypothetical protein